LRLLRPQLILQKKPDESPTIFCESSALVTCFILAFAYWGNENRYGLTQLTRQGLQRQAGASRWFVRGLLTNLLNPKVGVFYVTFLSQFIPSGVNVVGFSVLLALIHDVEGILWFAALTLATQPLVHWLCRPKILTILNRVTGGMFILFGARLALERKE
jgi:threonine/homoserine/homoserine lactone efflux protein